MKGDIVALVLLVFAVVGIVCIGTWAYTVTTERRAACTARGGVYLEHDDVCMKKEFALP